MSAPGPEQPPLATKPGSTAAGLKALQVTLEHARKQTGVVRALRVLSSANQMHGFDCPGCAWPDPQERSVAEFCENGAKAILDEATTKRVNEEFVLQHSLSSLRSLSEKDLNALGRITEPLLLERDAEHARVVSYEEAYEMLAEALSDLASPDRAAFYTSGRTSNEAAFAYQLLVRTLGTNNLPDCSNLCHESSGVALKQTLGIGKGTVRLDDFEQADLILVVGQNPGTNHPRMLTALRLAKKQGCTVVGINPLLEPGLQRFSHPQHLGDLLKGGIEIADHFLRVKVGGDQALFRALCKRLFEMHEERGGILDQPFIEQFTEGIAEFEVACKQSDWLELAELSGIRRSEIDELAELVSQKQRIIVCWAMGLTQHENSVDTICEVSNFLLLRGNVGRKGAGACPVRGHSNVQGDRTVGIAPLLPPSVAQRMSRRYGIEVPGKRGLDSVGTIEAMNRGEIDVFVSLGGNFLSACPDTEYTAAGLDKCQLSVHVATKLNRSHLAQSERTLIFPCLGRTERDLTSMGQLAGGGTDQVAQFVSVEDSMGVVHASAGNLEPASPALRGEPRLICELGEILTGKLRARGKVPSKALDFSGWKNDYSRLRDEIEACIPGFERYNQRVLEPGGFELDNGPRERRFTTPSSRARFVFGAVRRLQLAPGELMLMTLRSHDQFNTTVYSDEDRYRGISRSRRVLLLHPEDLRERGLENGERITITSHFGQGQDAQTRQLKDFFVVPYDVPRGSAVAYFPEANPLIFAGSFAAQSRTPTSKSTRVTIERQRDLPGADAAH